MPYPPDVRAAPGSRLVQLKRGSRPDRLVLVPGLGGSPLSFVSLARAYPGQEAIEVLEAGRGAGTSVEDRAAANLLATRALGAGSRLHLAGHSFGACVALEMARQAEGSGVRLGSVALLTPLLRLGGELDGGEREAAAARLLAAERLRERLGAAGEASARLAEDAEVVCDLADLDLDPALLRSGAGFAADLLGRAAAALRAYAAARPPRVSVPVHLLVAAGAGSPEPAERRRLRELTAGVVVHELPCPPADVLRPSFAPLLARMLASLVAQHDPSPESGGGGEGSGRTGGA